jgi:hypothetical protein
VHGKFGKKVQSSAGNWKHTEDLTIAEAVQRVLDELRRMGLGRDDVVISTNLVLRMDGLPRSDQRAPNDTGVAVYWEDRKGGRKVMAIDAYYKVSDNLAAVAATLEAMRAIERHGGAVVLERAFTGFTALPAPGAKRAYWEVMGLSHDATYDQVRARYRELASQHHPDKGGSPEKMAELNQAMAEAEEAKARAS